MIARLGTSSMARALARAAKCATTGTTNCVLHGEIGFAIPTAFIYDASEGMRAIVAPRLLSFESPVLNIRLLDPEGMHPNKLFEWNTTIKVEYLKFGARSMTIETLTGTDAYCVQSLRHSVSKACWDQLDGA